jgi:hypothetical protein
MLQMCDSGFCSSFLQVDLAQDKLTGTPIARNEFSCFHYSLQNAAGLAEPSDTFQQLRTKNITRVTWSANAGLVIQQLERVGETSCVVQLSRDFEGIHRSRPFLACASGIELFAISDQD